MCVNASVAFLPAVTHLATVVNYKKTDVAEDPQVFRHIGSLSNEPPGLARLLFI